MLSYIESSLNARRTLLYNEEKLELNQALFLGAFNYWQETESLTFENKLHRLRHLTVLNERSKAKTLHISLDFHPADKLTDKKMKQIAKEYMKALGFADQPWLLYRHIDAGHPHMHIVTTNIRPDGSRMSNDERSHYHQMKICSTLGKKHSLTPAEKQKMPDPLALRQKTGIPQPLKYGQIPTKTGIAGVLDHILENFRYTTLDQLNALLYVYRVRADRGSEQGIMYRNRGLYYRMIDENGKKIGAPIKASSFAQRPTLNYLEKKMEDNRLVMEQKLQLIKDDISWVLIGRPASLQEFGERLKAKRVRMIMPPPARQRQNRPPEPYTGHGFFYVDLQSKAIYRDTDLGTPFTAAAVIKKIALEATMKLLLEQQKLTISKKDRSILQDPSPDPAQKLNVLLSLARQEHWRQVKMPKEETDLVLRPRLRLTL